ncbi:transcription/translation regulatory transformer protein RfaH [Corallincola luteus]|uniref:Transcription/translation regulatory transformer protein RfaH n=1 Tax=Corallincola luteus TaxID=1775177 RepID=A0ABY2AQF0_9GAMM|nr:transcription/translation regulatory transformer protein RfaH [Corallincola luteus]
MVRCSDPQAKEFCLSSVQLENWFLLKVKARQEQRAVDNLELQLVEAYFPKITVTKISRGKRTAASEALFPGYIFARFNPQLIALTTIQSTRGVSAVVRFGNHLSSVPDQLIDEIKQRCGEMVAQIDASAPQSGDKVVITDGSLKGLDALYQLEDGEQRAFVLIDLLGKQQRVSVENIHLQKQ